MPLGILLCHSCLCCPQQHLSAFPPPSRIQHFQSFFPLMHILRPPPPPPPPTHTRFSPPLPCSLTPTSRSHTSSFLPSPLHPPHSFHPSPLPCPPSGPGVAGARLQAPALRGRRPRHQQQLPHHRAPAGGPHPAQRGHRTGACGAGGDGSTCEGGGWVWCGVVRGRRGGHLRGRWMGVG